MKKIKSAACLAALALVVSTTSTATAQPTIDGTADASYGAALSVQNTRTHFGDASSSDPVQTRADDAGGGGSEINQVFGTIFGDSLYVTVTGNLENNFNKLHFFIDSIDGGVNQIIGSEFADPDDINVPFGVDAFCCGGFTPPNGGNIDNIGAFQRMDGLTFDEGFDADYALIFSHGQENVAGTDFWAMNAHYAELKKDGAVVPAGIVLAPQGMPNVLRAPGDGLGDTPATIRNADDGSQAGASDTTMIGPALPGLAPGQLIDRTYAMGSGGCTDDTGAGCVAPELEFVLDVDPAEVGGATPNSSNHRNFNNTIGLQAAIDNSNTAGVLGSGGPFELVDGEDDPENVVTGIEFSIPLAALGNPTGDISLTAFINGSSFDYLANQFSGDGSLEGNEGGDGNGNGTGDLSGVNLANIAGDQIVKILASAGDPADLNNDGFVDGLDLGILLGNFDQSAAPSGGELNGTPPVDGLDLGILLGAWNPPQPIAGSQVPEPSTLAFVMIASLGILSHRRGK